MSKMIPAGIVTAYGAAVRGGYLGTYEEFCAALGDLARVLEEFEGFSVSVTTLEPGESAIADYSDGVLSLGIPAGETGNGIASAELNQNYTLTLTWTNGESTTVGPIRGATGQTPDFEIGTVQTLQPDQPASASITGTPEHPVLNLSIPKGDPGQDGASDAGDVTFDPEEDYDDGTVGKALKDELNAISTLDDAVIEINGKVLELDYDKDIVYGSGYYINDGQLAIASYPNKRIRVNRGISLKTGDIIEIQPFRGANSYLVWTEDNGITYNASSSSNPVIVSKDRIYYLTFMYIDNRIISDETARQLFSCFSFLRGTGNPAVQNGEKWAIDVSESGKANFFDRNHLISYRISTSTGEVISDSGNRMAWVKLPPNKTYNLNMIKIANSSVEVGLLNKEPVNGDFAINCESNYGNDVFNTTFQTTDEYCYYLIKYCMNDATKEKADEILDSIEIKISDGEITDKIIKGINNARHVKGNLDKVITLVHFSDLHSDQKR